MNRIYRVIRNRTYHRDVVVSEITKTSGKSSSEVRATARENPSFKSWLAGLTVAGLLVLPSAVWASDITDLKGNSLITPTQTATQLAGNCSTAAGASSGDCTVPLMAG